MLRRCRGDGDDPSGKLQTRSLVEQDGDLPAGGMEIFREAAEHAGPLGQEASVEGLAGEAARAEVFGEENAHRVERRLW
jgi:hypothetical protein